MSSREESFATSPPTKTSLSNWWKQFKQRQAVSSEDGSSGSSDTSGSAAATRPVLRHMSHSSGAVETVKNQQGATAAAGPSMPGRSSATPVIPPEVAESPIFGVALATSIRYASVSISLSDSSGEEFVYGRIPVVVGKCGVYLKKNATKIAGIFRVSGSARRVRELQIIFSSPPRFGKGLNWDGYTVHDAANVLSRYLNRLPEPIVPLDVYERFRSPLRERPAIIEYLESQSQTAGVASFVGSPPQLISPPLEAAGTSAADIHNLLARHQRAAHDDEDEPVGMTRVDDGTAGVLGHASDSVAGTPLFNDISTAIDVYQRLIAELPPLNRQLLMYILDMLSIFAAKSDDNLMPAPNLAAIFQPSTLSHPDHDMKPEEYHLSRAVIEFLIQHSNKFLSHVERHAIAEHESRKRAGIVGASQKPSGDSRQRQSGSSQESSPHSGPGSTATFAGSGNPAVSPYKQSAGSPHHRRRHSKSLSSVGGHTNGNVTSPRLNPYKQQPSPGSNELLALPKQRQASNPDDSNPGQASKNEGFFSTLKRNVSMTRRPSQQRSGSASSATSSQRRVSDTLAATQRIPSDSTSASVSGVPFDVVSSQRHDALGTDQGSIPEITVNSEADDARRTGRSALSALFSRRSRSPAARSDGSSLNASLQPGVAGGTPAGLALPATARSIDQTLATSPGSLQGADSMVHSPSRHHWNLHSVFSGKNESNSSLSNLGRTLSGGSSADGGAPYDDGDGRIDSMSPRKKEHVSRWRRSLMAFNFSEPGRDHQDGEYAGEAHLSPSSSSGRPQSPNRASALFSKMKLRDRSADSTDRVPAPTSAVGDDASRDSAGLSSSHEQ